MNLRLISEYNRSALMGFSILWIMFYHAKQESGFLLDFVKFGREG